MENTKKMIGIEPELFNELLLVLQKQPLGAVMDIWGKLTKEATELTVTVDEEEKKKK